MRSSTKSRGPKRAYVTAPRKGCSPMRELPGLGHNRRPTSWHLLHLEARLECHKAGPGSTSQSAAFLPAPVLRLTQTQEGQRQGCLHSRGPVSAPPSARRIGVERAHLTWVQVWARGLL